MLITKATLNDIGSIKTLYDITIRQTFIDEVIDESIDTPESEINAKLSYIESCITDTDAALYVMWEGDVLVGTVSYKHAEGDIVTYGKEAFKGLYEVGSLYIHPDHQGRGLTKMLLHQVLSDLSTFGEDVVCLDSGYQKAQRVWLHYFGKPHIIIKSLWGDDKRYMLWKCSITTWLENHQLKQK